MTTPRVLLTNDDGVDREGLLKLRDALIARDIRVTTLAPNGNRSGIGRAATIHGTVSVREVGGSERDPIYACTGTPVDCARIGLLADFGPGAPAALVSGVNHGTNLGDDLLFSGTVGAAVEAALHDVPGIAFSQMSVSGRSPLIETSPHRFHMTGFAAALVAAVLETPPPCRTALNVNLPHRLLDERPVIAAPARRRYERGWMQPVDGTRSEYAPYGSASQSDPPYVNAPDSDVHAVAAGAVALTPLSLAWSETGANARRLEWVHKLEIAAFIDAADQGEVAIGSGAEGDM